MTTIEKPADASGVALTAGLGPLVDSEEDPARLWAEIHLLRLAVQGPEGFATWREAAVWERRRRKELERQLAEAQQPKRQEATQEPRTLRERFAAWRERTGFFMDGRDGGM